MHLTNRLEVDTVTISSSCPSQQPTSQPTGQLTGQQVESFPHNQKVSQSVPSVNHRGYLVVIPATQPSAQPFLKPTGQP